MMVNILNIENPNNINIQQEHWNGHYIESNIIQHNRPKWIKDTNEDPLNTEGSLSFTPNTWEIYSSITGHRLKLNDEGLHPPTGTTSQWVLSYDYNFTATIELECSDTIAPTTAPTIAPSDAPSISPTQPPSIAPTQPPSISPTQPPSLSPTQPPSDAPSNAPVYSPSNSPTKPPSVAPSISPTEPPSITPTQPPSLSPITSCNILRVIINNLNNNNGYEQYKGHFYQQNMLINYRTNWYRHSDGGRIAYDTNNKQWYIIIPGNPLKPLIFKTGNGMPPIDINTPANWLIDDNNNNNNVIELILTCSNDKSLTPTYDPTTDPTTDEPTPRPTSAPTTAIPTTKQPTIDANPTPGKCIGYVFDIALKIIFPDGDIDQDDLKQTFLQAIIKVILKKPHITEFIPEWCMEITKLIVNTDASVNGDVAVSFSVNEVLYSAYFKDFNKNKFMNQLQEVLNEDNDDNDNNNQGGGGNDKSDMPLGLGEECNVFKLLCWQLYVIIIILVIEYYVIHYVMIYQQVDFE